MRLGAVASGSLALIVLEVVVTSQQTSRIGDLLVLPAAWARRLIDPSIPAIGNHAKADLGGGSSGAAAASMPTAPRSPTPKPSRTPGAFNWQTATI